jgi:hypothetical protein
VYRTSPAYGGMGVIGLTDYIGSFDETLYEYSQNEPSFVISQDGKYLYLTSNHSGQSSELYKMEFIHPIPEFPFTIPILLVSFASVIVFYNMKFRK